VGTVALPADFILIANQIQFDANAEIVVPQGRGLTRSAPTVSRRRIGSIELDGGELRANANASTRERVYRVDAPTSVSHGTLQGVIPTPAC
jgi:hypothetical protein